MTLKKFLISGAICSLLMSSNYALAQTTTATSSTTTAAVEATISWLKTLYWQVTDLIATIENLKTTKTRSANNKNTSSLGSDGNNNGSRNLNNSNSGRQGSGNIVSPNSNPAGTGSGGGSSNPLTSRNSDVYRGTGLTEKPTTDTREIPPEPKTDQPESDTARDGAGPRGAIQKDSVPAEAQGERTSKIDTIVLHATFSDIDGKNKGAREDDTQKIKQEWKDSGRKLSAHYIINKKGTIYQMVAEDKTANHAGTSKMPFDGRTGVNDFSIGIELAYYPDKTDSQGKARDGEPNRFQYDALKRLIPEIKSRQQIKYIVLHCQIAGKDVRGGGTGNEIKKDPERFEWSKIESVLQGGIQHLKTNCEGQTS